MAKAGITAVLFFQTTPDSAAAADLVGDSIARVRAAFGEIPIYTNRATHDLRVVADKSADNPSAALTEVLEATAHQDQDSVAYFRDFAPHFDAELFEEQQAMHFQYMAHYTYSDNIPQGMLPDLASLDFVRSLKPNLPDDLRAFVFKNINDYDVEIFYKLPDLRQQRLDLSTASARSQALALTLRDRAPRFAELEALIEADPSVVRPFPSYLEVELTRAANASPAYQLPPPAETPAPGHMDERLIEKLCTEIAASALPGDLTIALGGQGDPLLHPDLRNILKRLLTLAPVKCVYLETYGDLLDQEFLEYVAGLQGAQNLEIIVRLPTLKRERYAELYRADLLDRVLSNVACFEELARAGKINSQLHVEMLKITDVQDEITEYFDRFEDSPVNVILQKFNSYAGQVPERRVSDLTPLHRDFCWHLRRDMYLCWDGSIPLCKQDPYGQGQFKLDFGSVSILDFLEQSTVHHTASVRGELDQIPMPCQSCDEWYTFNG